MLLSVSNNQTYRLVSHIKYSFANCQNVNIPICPLFAYLLENSSLISEEELCCEAQRKFFN